MVCLHVAVLEMLSIWLARGIGRAVNANMYVASIEIVHMCEQNV